MPVIRAHIRERADARGWTAAQLAEQVGIDAPTAQRLYTSEPADVDLATLSRLSQVFGVLPHQLLGSVEQKQPSATVAQPPRAM